MFQRAEIRPETLEEAHIPGRSGIHGSSDDIRKNGVWFALIRYRFTTHQYEALLLVDAKFRRIDR